MPSLSPLCQKRTNQTIQFLINDQKIDRVKETVFLGVIMDENLNWYYFVSVAVIFIPSSKNCNWGGLINISFIVSFRPPRHFFLPSICCCRLRVFPHFSSGILERAKRERAWKSPHARKGDTRRGERKMRDPSFSHFLFFSLPAACPLFSRGVIFTPASVSLAVLSEEKWGTTRSLVLLNRVYRFSRSWLLNRVYNFTSASLKITLLFLSAKRNESGSWK